MRAETRLAGAGGIGNQDASDGLQDPQRLRNALLLRRPQRAITREGLGIEVVLGPLAIEELGAGTRQRLLPRDPPKQGLQQLDQLLRVVRARRPIVLGDRDRVAKASAVMGRSEPDVRLELRDEARLREVARAERDRLIAAIDLGVQSGTCVSEIASLDLSALQSLNRLDQLETERRRDIACEPVFLDLLRERTTATSVPLRPSWRRFAPETSDGYRIGPVGTAPETRRRDRLRRSPRRSAGTRTRRGRR